MKNIAYDLGLLSEEACAPAPHQLEAWEDALLQQQKKRISRTIRTCIQTGLTPKQRQAVLLYYGKQQTTTQIGRTLGVSRAAISRRLGRAKARLREALRPYLEG